MADESFPTINYVQPGEGTNLLPSLIALYGAYKQSQSNKQGDQYLQGHPYQGAQNMGALEAAMKIFGGKEGEARTSELGNEGQAALTNAASRQTEVGNEGAYQQGMLANDTAKTGNEAAYQTGLLNNDTLRTTNEGNYQTGELADRAAQTAAQDKDRTMAVTDKADTAKNAQVMGLMEHYMTRANSGVPLSPKEEAEYDQVKQAAFKAGGIDMGQPAGAPNVNPGGAIPFVTPKAAAGGPQTRSRAAQALQGFSQPMQDDSFDPMNRVMNTLQNAYNTVNPDVDRQGNTVGASTKHHADLGDLPADVAQYLHSIYNSKRSK